MILATVWLLPPAFSQVAGRNIRWNVTAVADVLTGGSRSHQFKQVITRPDKVDFISPEGKLTASLAIVSTSGTWSDLAADGMTTFKVEAGAQKGQVIVKRVRGRLSITLLLNQPDSHAIFDLDCSGFEVLNP